MINRQSTRGWRRSLSLVGGYNFRDLGNYPTQDNRRIRRGRIFRSSSLSNLAPSDISELARRGIRTICDLRSGPERLASPNHWARQEEFDYWSGQDSQATGDPLPSLAKCIVSADQTRLVACDIYRVLPFEQADSFREIFNRLAAGNTPLVFHCAAGKDRTGAAAALILAALGVPRKTIMADYILTDKAIDHICAMFLADSRNSVAIERPREVWFPILKADPLYLETMFQEIERRHGSVEAYLAEVIGLDQSDLSAIRDHLLE